MRFPRVLRFFNHKTCHGQIFCRETSSFHCETSSNDAKEVCLRKVSWLSFRCSFKKGAVSVVTSAQVCPVGVVDVDTQGHEAKIAVW